MKITIRNGSDVREIEAADGTQVSDGYHTFDELYTEPWQTKAAVGGIGAYAGDWGF